MSVSLKKGIEGCKRLYPAKPCKGQSGCLQASAPLAASNQAWAKALPLKPLTKSNRLLTALCREIALGGTIGESKLWRVPKAGFRLRMPDHDNYPGLGHRLGEVIGQAGPSDQRTEDQ